MGIFKKETEDIAVKILKHRSSSDNSFLSAIYRPNWRLTDGHVPLERHLLWSGLYLGDENAYELINIYLDPVPLLRQFQGLTIHALSHSFLIAFPPDSNHGPRSDAKWRALGMYTVNDTLNRDEWLKLSLSERQSFLNRLSSLGIL